MNLKEAVEALVTAEIYNRNDELDEDDLPPRVRKVLWSRGNGGVERPARVSEGRLFLDNGEEELRSLPFVDYDAVSEEYLLTVLELGVNWLVSRSVSSVETNPVLAFHLEEFGGDADYELARSGNAPKETSREYVESLIERLTKDEEAAEEMLELVHVVPPEEVVQTLDDIVLTDEQRREIEKVAKAIEYRDYLHDVGLREVGKLLFVGPPGTGKTTTATALSEELSIPLLEVRLSMVTSRYLGETSKNIDRAFELAKQLAPCVLFIDEFDFVAKTRTSDEHAALKRAVNTLLKSVDDISLVDDGVVLIGATNHPKLLDAAVWRRFDEIVHFPMPDEDMRRAILDGVLDRIDGEVDTAEIAGAAEGFSGSDLRLLVREAVLTGLSSDRTELGQEDLLDAVEDFRSRDRVRREVVEEMDRLDGS